MKIGRNDPCHCGSGKKYKKCCFLTNGNKQRIYIADEIIKKFKESQQNEIAREKLYGKTRPIIHANCKGYKFVAVGNKIHYNKTEKWKTFIDFLLDYIKIVLDVEWGKSELKKPFEKRHQILKWYDGMCRFQQSQIKKDNGIYITIPNGSFAAYILLAYDLYILKHHKTIQEDIIKRLKHPDQFQGARYELFATSTCVRAGFDIEFENEKDGSKKHTEFIAIHKKTGQKISVEAKSKHRKGIPGYLNLQKIDKTIKLRVGNLINKALDKGSIYPLVIFVDVNISPDMANKILEVPTPNGIVRTLNQIKKTNDGKDIFNLIIFTNHPHHYGEDDKPDPKKNVVSVFSQIPKIIPSYPQVLSDLSQSALQYGKIPNEFPEN